MYEIDLDVYQGPFDLLLDLIAAEKIEIWDIPIARIVHQYLAYLQRMQEMDLAIGSEFLVMAAQLLEIKAKMLLPQHGTDDGEAEDNEQDPREELVARLLEYKMYKEIAEYLREAEHLGASVFSRGYRPPLQDQEPVFSNPVGVDVKQLSYAFAQVLAAAKETVSVQEIPRRVSVKERIGELRLRLAAAGQVAFSQLFAGSERWDIILTFLAVLELIRLGELRAYQQGRFAEIMIEFVPQSTRRGSGEARRG